VEFKGEYHFLQRKIRNLLIIRPGENFSINIFNPGSSLPEVHAERVFDILKSGKFLFESAYNFISRVSYLTYTSSSSGEKRLNRNKAIIFSIANKLIAADVWRFYIYYNRPESADALFTWSDFQEKVNSELIGNLGNLVNRSLTFVSRYYDGVVPKESEGDSKRSEEFWLEVESIEKESRANVSEAVEFALASPFPSVEMVLRLAKEEAL